MSAVIPGVKLLNREIIRPYELHSHFDQFLGGLGQEVREVLAKSFVPEAGIPGVEQNAFRLVETAAGEKVRIDLRHFIRHAYYSRRANQSFKRERIDLSRALNEMRWRIHVRSRVRAEMQKRNVCGIALRHRRPSLDLHAGMAFVNGHARANRDADIVSLHLLFVRGRRQL